MSDVKKGNLYHIFTSESIPKSFLESNTSNKRHKECLAGTVLTNDKSEGCATLSNSFNIIDKRLEFFVSYNLNVLKSCT
jgi:hypothetical protein